MRKMAVLVLVLLPLVGMHRQLEGQATATIMGQVTGDSGQPLSGAIVRITESNIGALTGADGRYTLSSVPAGSQTVRVALLGYGEMERSVTVGAGETATVDFQLSTQALALEGIVAVGYGTMRRQDVTGSVAAVPMTNIENLPIRGATEALVGQMPGVNVITSTGAPGSGAQVQIRGVSAVGAGSTPLYVVDGFPITASTANDARGFTMRSPLADISPNDIESITVLKDASAAAIYGSQAANGVVIITTKRGQALDRPQIDIRAMSGFQTADMSRFPQVANATEFAIFMNRRWRQLNPNAPLSQMPEEWQNPERYGEGTNWYREVMQSAPTQELTASVSGGSERVRAYVSGGYLTQTGILSNSDYMRVNARANLEANLSDRVMLGFSLAPTYSTRSLSNEGGVGRTGGFGSTLHVWPTDTPYEEDGTLKKLVWGSTGGATQRNPVNVLQETQNAENALTTLITTFLEVDLLRGMQLRSSMNVNRSDRQLRTFLPSTLWTATGPAIPEGQFSSDQGMGWLNENTLNVDRQISDAQRIQLLGGFTAQQTRSQGGLFTGNNFPDDEVRTLNAAATITGETSESEWAMASVFARANYTLLDRYVFTGTLRTDGSSRFGANNRWGTFPSLAFAWNVSEEPFMNAVSFAQDARLRVSFGYTGNNQIGNYSSIGIVERADYVLGGSQTAGMRISSMGNPDLGWERAREWNIGLDAFLFDRIGLTTDAYRRVTENLLLSLELPTASGFGSVTANQGSIQNTGFEVGVTVQTVETPRFRWFTNANVSVNRNKALSLSSADTLLSGASMEGANTHITVVGQPVGLFYGYRIIGVYTPEDIANPDVAKYAGAVAGDVKYKDVNGDGVIRQREDFEVIGTPYPKFTWGLTNTMTFGRFDFRTTVDGSVGGQRLNRNLATIENIDGPFNVSKRYVQDMLISWDSIGSGMAPGPGFSSAAGRRAFRDVSDRWVEDAGFVWVRNVQLTYNLPERLSSAWLNSRRASIYANVANPYIFTSFNGNPQTEANQVLTAQGAPSSPSLTPGVDNFTYPLARLWALGINLGL